MRFLIFCSFGLGIESGKMAFEWRSMFIGRSKTNRAYQNALLMWKTFRNLALCFLHGK